MATKLSPKNARETNENTAKNAEESRDSDAIIDPKTDQLMTVAGHELAWLARVAGVEPAALLRAVAEAAIVMRGTVQTLRERADLGALERLKVEAQIQNVCGRRLVQEVRDLAVNMTHELRRVEEVAHV